MLTSVSYEKISDQGLHIKREGKSEIIEADNIIICAGQVPNTQLYELAKVNLSRPCHIIGGAYEAFENTPDGDFPALGCSNPGTQTYHWFARQHYPEVIRSHPKQCLYMHTF